MNAPATNSSALDGVGQVSNLSRSAGFPTRTPEPAGPPAAVKSVAQTPTRFARPNPNSKFQNPNSTYRAAVIGCGRIGCAFDDDPKRHGAGSHAGAYVRSPRFELVALCDLDRDRVERYADKFSVRGRYGDVAEMLAAESPDVVSVCTRADTHESLVRAAVEAGVRGVFCEKPLADLLAAADGMVRLCRDAGVPLLVGHQRRFDPLHRDVQRFIHEGRLGDIQQATCYYTAGIANTGSHMIDLLRMFLDDVVWVRAQAGGPAPANAADPNLDAWIGFASGATAALQACDVRAYTIFEVNLLGTLGRLRLMSHGFELDFEEVRDHPRYTGYNGLCSAPPPLSASRASETPLQFAMENLARALDTGREPLSSGADGRAALEVIAALLESADHGGKRVELPLKDRRRLIAS